jgi:hypothetical protein
MTTIYDSILNWILGLLPNSEGFPNAFTQALGTYITYLNGFDYVFPVSTIFQILVLYVSFEILVLLWNLARMIANLVRGSGA